MILLDSHTSLTSLEHRRELLSSCILKILWKEQSWNGGCWGRCWWWPCWVDPRAQLLVRWSGVGSPAEEAACARAQARESKGAEQVELNFSSIWLCICQWLKPEMGSRARCLVLEVGLRSENLENHWRVLRIGP